MSDEIRINLRGGNDVVRFSMEPEEIRRSGSAMLVAITTLAGEVEKHTGAGIAVYSWDGMLPGRERSERAYVHSNRWENPLRVDRLLDRWRKDGTVLTMIISGSNFSDDVTIASYDSSIAGGMGDVMFSIELHEHRDLRVRTSKKKKGGKNGSGRKKGNNDRGKGGTPSKDGRVVTYTVKAGDTLAIIAKKFLGSTTRWREIFEDNKKPKGPISNPDVLQVGWELKIDKRS